MRHTLFIMLLLSVSVYTNAQQLPYFRNEIYAPQWHNPASFGTWNKFSVNGLAQHSSFFSDYNYGSGLFTAEGFIGVGKSNSGIGIGGAYLYDRFGFQQSNSFNLMLNYQFAFEKFHLSIGAAPGILSIRQNSEWLPPSNVPDPNLPSAGVQIKPMLGTGVYFYTDKLYAGISIAQLNSPFYDELNYQSAPHYFLNAGYRFKVSKNIQLFPSVILGSDAAVTHFNATFLVQFMKPAITLGLGYGITSYIRGVIGYEFKGIALLYSLGTNLSILTNANYFHQEIRLTYKLKKKPKCSTCEHF
jgi:type IX secretion system PorP/SprF family membrane protein